MEKASLKEFHVARRHAILAFIYTAALLAAKSSYIYLIQCDGRKI